jgi:phospholipase D1/2
LSTVLINSLANEYVYIETQYVRAVDVANAIVQRFQANKKLQVIIVVPIVPEELKEGKADQLTLHGLFLQHEAMTMLRTSLGPNLGLYSLVQNAKAKTDKKSRNLSSFGSLRIYPHSKVLVVDDVFASIGSANVNPRGFELDLEIDLGWHEPPSVKAFRQQLWREHLGSSNGSLFATWKPANYVKEWDAIAKANTTVPPMKRQGFIVPHDPDLAKGTKQVFPDFLVQLESQEREDPVGRMA